MHWNADAIQNPVKPKFVTQQVRYIRL